MGTASPRLGAPEDAEGESGSGWVDRPTPPNPRRGILAGLALEVGVLQPKLALCQRSRLGGRRPQQRAKEGTKGDDRARRKRCQESQNRDQPDEGENVENKGSRGGRLEERCRFATNVMKRKPGGDRGTRTRWCGVTSQGTWSQASVFIGTPGSTETRYCRYLSLVKGGPPAVMGP